MDFQSSCRSNKRGLEGTEAPRHQLTAHFHRHTREKRESDRGEREREREKLPHLYKTPEYKALP
jgi:hypothetical protein